LLLADYLVNNFGQIGHHAIDPPIFDQMCM